MKLHRVSCAMPAMPSGPRYRTRAQRGHNLLSRVRPHGLGRLGGVTWCNQQHVGNNFLNCIFYISFFVHEFLYFCMDVMQFYMSIFFFALIIFMFSNLASVAFVDCFFLWFYHSLLVCLYIFLYKLI